MDLKSKYSLQVGDENTRVKAVSFHQNPMKLFGQEVKGVLAVLTTKAVLIYHKNGDAFDNILRHRWMENVVVSATSLDWHPSKAELFVGDEEGHITVFKYEKGDEGTCPYIFNNIYKNEKDKVCSLSWSQDGKHLAAAFTHHLVMFSRYRDGFMEKVINLDRGPCNYVVKFHPVESYLFVGAENNRFLQVFTNLSPDLKPQTEKQQTEWRQIICIVAGGVRAICFDKKELKGYWKDSIVLATAGKSPTVWSFHGYTGISEPKLCVLDVLDEDRSSKGLLNSITFHNDTRKYIVCGFDNGTCSLYKASSKRNATDNKKMFFVPIKRKWAGHEYPSVTCLVPHPMDNLSLVGGSYGFLYFFRLINEVETKKPLQDIEKTQRSQRSKISKIQGNTKREVNLVSLNRQMEPDVSGTHQQQKAFAPLFGSSLVPDVEAGNLSQTIPGQKILTSHPPMLQQQQDLWSTCLSLQQLVNQLQKQLELLQYNLPAQQQQMPQQQMSSQQAPQLLLQQELALKSTCSSSQDLLQKLEELMPLIQQPAAQDCHTQLPAPGSMELN